MVLGWILTVHYGACRGILAHPDFSPLHARAAGQQHEAVPPSGKSSVAQNNVPEYLPPSVCRAQRRMNSFGCREAIVPFLTKDPRSLEVGRSQFCWCGCERRGGSSQPLPRNSFLPWIFPDHNRRVCSHFLLVSQLIFPLPAVICRWFLGHEHWPWAETHRKLGMASRHLCHQ